MFTFQMIYNIQISHLLKDKIPFSSSADIRRNEKQRIHFRYFRAVNQIQ